MMPYDALTNDSMFSRCFKMFYDVFMITSDFPTFRMCVSIGDQFRDSVTPVQMGDGRSTLIPPSHLVNIK